MPYNFSYATANIFIVMGTMLTMKGGLWTWSGLLLSYFLFGLLDDKSDAAQKLHPNNAKYVSNFMLYLTLPLLVCQTAIVFYSTGASIPKSASDIFQIQALDHPDPYYLASLIGAFTSLGMYFGMIGGTVAHELIHRNSNKDLIIGYIFLAPLWDTGFAIEHIYGHHRYVATKKDTATARRGESIYNFYVRSSIAQMIAALQIEKNRLLRQSTPDNAFNNRFVQGQLLSLFVMIIFVFFYGAFYGFIACIYTASVGRFYIRVTDYITHYGLVRILGETVSPRHSWDCHNRLSVSILYNLPLHADHHCSGNKPFWELKGHPTDAPQLPWGYLSAGLIALIPPIWHKVMRPHLADWDSRLASEEEIQHLLNHGIYYGNEPHN